MIKWVRGTLMLLAIEEYVCNKVGGNSQCFFADHEDGVTRISGICAKRAEKNKILTAESEKNAKNQTVLSQKDGVKKMAKKSALIFLTPCFLTEFFPIVQFVQKQPVLLILCVLCVLCGLKLCLL